MAAAVTFTITSLLEFFGDERKSINRGENHVKSSHIESWVYSDGILSGEVHASMKKKVYKVKVCVDEKSCIRTSECECPRGEYRCSHAAALYIYAINNISRTDVECSWKKRKTPAAEAISSAADMYPTRRPDYCALTLKPTAEDRAELYGELKRYGHFTGLTWLLSPEPTASSMLLPINTVDSVIHSATFLALPTDQQEMYVRDALKVTQEEVAHVSSVTVGQRDVPAWHFIRKGRLTASNFGSVLSAKRVRPSLLKRLLGEYDLSGVKAIQWGITNECEAVKAFTAATGEPVTETGVWLDGSGVLGASPDGLVGSDYVLEVKCPYTQRTKSIDEACADKGFCLTRQDNGMYVLPEKHAYWHQVQGQMYVTGRPYAYFVVWTLNGLAIIVIARDPNYINQMEILRHFYFEQILPRLVSGDM